MGKENSITYLETGKFYNDFNKYFEIMSSPLYRLSKKEVDIYYKKIFDSLANTVVFLENDDYKENEIFEKAFESTMNVQGFENHYIKHRGCEFNNQLFLNLESQDDVINLCKYFNDEGINFIIYTTIKNKYKCFCCYK